MCLDTLMYNLSPYDFLCGDGVGGRNLLKKRFVDACVSPSELRTLRLCIQQYTIEHKATIRCQQYECHTTLLYTQGWSVL